MIQDNDLYFNEELKRYYLTEDYVYNRLGTDLNLLLFDELDTNLATLPKRTIAYACDMLYDYVENNAYHKLSTQYAFTTNKQVHNALKKALGYQLFFFIQNGDASNSPGASIKDTVSSRAVQTLHSANAFHVYYTSIPKEW